MSSFGLVLGTYCNGLFNAKGKTYLSLLAQVLHLVVLIPVLVWSSKLGYHTLYISRTLVRVELILVELILMKWFLNFPVSNLFKDIIPACICSFIMYICGVLLNLVCENVVYRFFSVVICMLVYIIFSKVFFGDLLIESMDIFGFNIRFGRKKHQ